MLRVRGPTTVVGYLLVSLQKRTVYSRVILFVSAATFIEVVANLSSLGPVSTATWELMCYMYISSADKLLDVYGSANHYYVAARTQLISRSASYYYYYRSHVLGTSWTRVEDLKSDNTCHHHAYTGT